MRAIGQARSMQGGVSGGARVGHVMQTGEKGEVLARRQLRIQEQVVSEHADSGAEWRATNHWIERAEPDLA
jgi:hypothetical protein